MSGDGEEPVDGDAGVDAGREPDADGARDDVADEDPAARSPRTLGRRGEAGVPGGDRPRRDFWADEIADVAGLSAATARVAVEGARELLGEGPTTADRLASATGAEHESVEAALSSLAASGVAPSEAAPVLERLYGPSLVDLEGVTGEQAYHLWEAGYRTPADLVAADPGALEAVPSVGPKTAPDIVAAARAVTTGTGHGDRGEHDTGSRQDGG